MQLIYHQQPTIDTTPPSINAIIPSSSYTEQWANQLNYWDQQQLDASSNFDPNRYPISPFIQQQQQNNLAIVHPMMMAVPSKVEEDHMQQMMTTPPDMLMQYKTMKGSHFMINRFKITLFHLFRWTTSIRIDAFTMFDNTSSND